MDEQIAQNWLPFESKDAAEDWHTKLAPHLKPGVALNPLEQRNGQWGFSMRREDTSSDEHYYRITQTAIITRVYVVAGVSAEDASDTLAGEDQVKPVEEYTCGWPETSTEGPFDTFEEAMPS